MNASLEPPTSQVGAPPVPEKRQSGLGIASFVIAIIAVIITVVVVGYAGYVEVTTEGGMDETSPVAIFVGLGIFACIGLLLISTILGIINVFQKDRKRVLGAIGASLSATMIVLIALLMWVGMSQG